MEWISLILNVLLGGGVLVSLLTLRSQKAKAKAEAAGAELENDEKASKMLMEYIVEPLKKEVNGLRKDVRKLQRAIDRIGSCPYADRCPVRDELQNDAGNDSKGE